MRPGAASGGQSGASQKAPSGAFPRPRSNLALTLLALLAITAFTIFSALGVWQVQRRAWKLDLIERVSSRLHSPPVALPSPDEWPRVNAAGYEYLPVRLEGHWLADKTVLTQAVTELGSGSWVITPLQQADGTQVLVNRGFVPQGQSPKPALADGHATNGKTSGTPTVVQGLMRMSEPHGGFLRANDPAHQRWYSRDVQAIASTLRLSRAAPFFIDAGIPAASSSVAPPEPVVPANGDWPRSGMTVVRFPNSHQMYALTWFGLALMVAGAAAYVARYEIRLRKAQRDHALLQSD